jgi:hypothetical protein
MSATPLREAALAAIAARLVAMLPDVAVERARRAPVDTSSEALPRLILHGEDWAADTSQEPGITHYTLGFAVTGYLAAGSDLAAEQALSALHARVVAVLCGWTLDASDLGEPVEQGAEFELYDAEDSARPAGEFRARFEMLALAPTGAPYVA